MESLIDNLFIGLIAGAIISVYWSGSDFPTMIKRGKISPPIIRLLARAGRMKALPYYLYVWLLYGVLLGVVCGVGMQLISLLFKREQSASIYYGTDGHLILGVAGCSVLSLVMAWRLRKHVHNEKPEQQE